MSPPEVHPAPVQEHRREQRGPEGQGDERREVAAGGVLPRDDAPRGDEGLQRVRRARDLQEEREHVDRDQRVGDEAVARARLAFVSYRQHEAALLLDRLELRYPSTVGPTHDVPRHLRQPVRRAARATTSRSPAPAASWPRWTRGSASPCSPSSATRRPARITALADIGVREVALGLPAAAARHPSYAAFEALAGDRRPEDDQWADAAAEALADARHRTRARQVYVPLGVGAHIDHRLAHDAALRAFDSGDGRNVFLYEERPEAFVRGAVRIRLGQVGARLPPGAAEAADDTGLAAFLLRFHVPPSLRGDLKGWAARARGRAGGRPALARGPVVAPGKGVRPPAPARAARDAGRVARGRARHGRGSGGVAAGGGADEQPGDPVCATARRARSRGEVVAPAAPGRARPADSRGGAGGGGRGGLLSRRHAGSGSASSAFHRSGSWSHSVLRYVRICSPV